MNVLVLTNMVPFVWGGAEELTRHLVRNLRLQGANAEAMRIPFSGEPAERVIDEIVICRSLRLWNVDRVIALKFPTYHIPHENKVLWVLHQFRQAYDLWDAGQTNIPDTQRGRAIREIVHTSDKDTFATARKVFTLSATTQERMRHYNGFQSEILMQPLNDPELFTGGQSQGFVLAAGRVNTSKRQWLMLETMRHLPRSVKLVIAGPPDSEADVLDLRARIASAGLEDRVRLDLRFLPREELAELVNSCHAVAYLPYDEDGPGYVTMEAFLASKPVVTVKDSGGLLQIVRDGETGCVCDPEPEALASAIAVLIEHPNEAARRGRAGHELLKTLNPTWPATIGRLLS